MNKQINQFTKKDFEMISKDLVHLEGYRIPENGLIHNIYDELRKDLSERLGPKTIVMMQLGSFYEFYTTINQRDDPNSPTAIAGRLLNILTAKKQDGVWMAGVPVGKYEQHRDVLLNHGYTVVRIDQETNSTSTSAKKQRTIKEVCVPAWFDSKTPRRMDNWTDSGILSVCLDETSQNMGIVMMDPVNSEVYWEENCENDLITELIQYWYHFPVRTIYLSGELKNISILKNYADIRQLEKVNLNMEIYDNIIRKIWKKSSNDLVFCNMNEYVKCALYQGIREIWQCDKEGCSYLGEPLKLDGYTQKYGKMKIWGDSVTQLDIFPRIHELNERTELKCIYDILSRQCITQRGQQWLKRLFLSPFTDVKEINKYHESVSILLEKGYGEITSNLEMTEVSIQSVRRNLLFETSKLTHDVWKLKKWIDSVQNLMGILSKLRSSERELVWDKWGGQEELSEFQREFENEIDVTKLEEWEMRNVTGYRESPIQKERQTVEEREIRDEIIRYQEELIKWVAELVTQTGVDENGVLIRWGPDQIKVTMTAKIGKQMRDSHKLTSDYRLETRKTDRWFVNHNRINMINEELLPRYEKLTNLVERRWNKHGKSLFIKYRQIFQEWCERLSVLDVIRCYSVAAIKNRWSRPIVKISEDGGSIRATEMRHPLLELLHQNTAYVSNNVTIGGKCELREGKMTNGMLLYGVNASGKSSYMKAVGVNTILCQMGCFVAAKTWEQVPFSCIITRINGNDNMLEGKSSFAVEISELRQVQYAAHSKTLLLGDEICRGTEIISAISLVGGMIKYLSEHNVRFIFATHLHTLQDIQMISEINTIGFYHMHIDQFSDGRLRYERKLRPGRGSNQYGIMVARIMGLNEDILNYANSIRDDLSKTNWDRLFEKSTNSRYNSDLKVESCEICQLIEDTLDTHHIEFQSEAKKANGTVNNGASSVHDKHNLVVLCKRCHQAVHKGKIMINGWKSYLGVDGKEERRLEWFNVQPQPQPQMDLITDSSGRKRRVKTRSLEDLTTEEQKNIFHMQLLIDDPTKSSHIRQIQRRIREMFAIQVTATELRSFWKTFSEK